jgi:hypothetical protein
MKHHVHSIIGLSGLIILLGGCSAPASSQPASKSTAPKEAVQTQPPTPSSSLEYQMSDADFEKKFGIARSDMARAPEARLATVPPLPAKMFKAQRGGWIDFVVEVDTRARVSKVEVIGYSEPDIVIPASADSIWKWWFFDGTKPGQYLLRITFTLVGPYHADVSIN